MNEPERTPPAGPAQPKAPGAPAVDAWRRWLPAAVGLVLVCVLWGLWSLVGGGSSGVVDTDAVARLEQEVTTLRRSDQISREANLKLQGTLAERDEEIAALRADVAFYERFVGATAQRRGLTVHELRIAPGAGRVWHYTATLTQNLNRDAASEGELRLGVEGTRDGRLQQLDWDDLRQSEGAAPLAYSFRFFQQVEGDIVLPEGFVPSRVTVRLQPRGGRAVEQSFPWAEATGRSVTDA